MFKLALFEARSLRILLLRTCTCNVFLERFSLYNHCFNGNLSFNYVIQLSDLECGAPQCTE